jgi:acetylornithine deacetylase/succinyl-diaminopimelate desuccinylase-like protein
MSLDPEYFDRLLDLAIAIQQVAAPTFAEQRRAELVYTLFQQEGLLDVTLEESGNVLARLPGTGQAPPLVVSAHLDTVFPEHTDLSVTREAGRICGPGIGDNALGLAGLFGLVWALRERPARLPGDLWLAANVGEEGLGDLRGMVAVVERFAGLARAFLVLEGMAFGQIYHRGLGVRRYAINTHTHGGHSWVDYGLPSAVHELAHLVTRLAGLALAEQPRTTLNIGLISGGTSVNTIAAEAHCVLDMRSEDAPTLAALAGQVEALVIAACRPGVETDFEVVGQRPVGELPAAHPLVQLAATSLEAQGIAPRLNIGSTDANIPLSRGLPAITLGLTTGGGAHTLHEYILTANLEKGMRQLLAVVQGIFNN